MIQIEQINNEYFKLYKKPYYTTATLNDPRIVVYRRLRCDSNGKLLNSDGSVRIRKKRVNGPNRRAIRSDTGKTHNYPKNRKSQ